jgi:drug/metabolite transporter (DMT)-like permease
MKLKEWVAFILLGLIWGSSFLWIKIGVENITPFVLVTFRVSFGLLGLLVVMYLQRQSFPRDRATIMKFVFMGVFNTVVPFLLITWGETKIDSGLASILNAATPLFVIVIAHFWLHDEKITAPRLAGLIMGFVGVVVLVLQNLKPDGGQNDIVGELAVLLATVSYAVALIFSRKSARREAGGAIDHDPCRGDRRHVDRHACRRSAAGASLDAADMDRRDLAGCAGPVCGVSVVLLS